jgi:MFS family permease
MASQANMSHTWLPAHPPKSSRLIAILLVFCSMITSTTFGYDGSMLNGLNILPSYTNYFHLTPATTGLQTASVFIGGCLSLLWGPVTDKLGRRPALLWTAVITLLAVVLQTAAQDVAMFTIARILIGFGTSASGLSGPVYLAETLPLHWRGWGLGFFNVRTPSDKHPAPFYYLLDMSRGSAASETCA